MMICCPSSSKCVSKSLLRIAFGATLALYGASHYRDLTGFVTFTSSGFTGVVANLAQVWAYVLPLFMIVGGVLLLIPFRKDIGAWCAGVALASIAIGMSLKAVIGTENLTNVGPNVDSALLWLLVYVFAVKSSCCGCGSGKEMGGGMGHACTPGGGCC